MQIYADVFLAKLKRMLIMRLSSLILALVLLFAGLATAQGGSMRYGRRSLYRRYLCVSSLQTYRFSVDSNLSLVQGLRHVPLKEMQRCWRYRSGIRTAMPKNLPPAVPDPRN